MKNFQYLVGLVLFLVICGCDSENNDSAAATPIDTIKNISEKIYYNGSIDESAIDYNYNNGVLLSISSGLNKIVFEYNNDKITIAKIYTNNVLQGTIAFSYNDAQLIKIENNDNDQKTEFSYINGLLATKKSFYKNGTSWIARESTAYSFDTNSNIFQTNSSFLSTAVYTQNFEYDNKNNIFKNMNPYLRYFINAESFDLKSINNITKSYTVVSGSAPVLSNNYVIIYNDRNYPINIKKFNVQNNANTLVSACTISYN